MLFIALVLQKQRCLLRWFFLEKHVYCASFTETTLFIALVFQKQRCLLRGFCRNNVVYCARFTRTMLFIALVLQKQCFYCAGFTETILIHYGTFFFIIRSYQSLNKSPVDEAVRVTCALYSNRAVTTSSALHKKLFCLRDSVHSGSCDHQMHFRKTQILAVIAAYRIAAVFESYASIVSKLKGHGMVTRVHFAVTKFLSTSGSSRAAPWLTKIATELAPVGQRSEFDAMSITT
jgi:hypothetical protein